MKKVVLITGGNGGIGRNVVKKFIDKGDYVIIADLNEIDYKTNETENIRFVKTDVTNVEDIKKLEEIIRNEYKHIDHIISMAGINMKSEIGGIHTITLEDIEKSIKLNLNSHIYLTKIMLDLLKKSEENRKSITMISSINAITNYGLPAYSAGKAGIYGFMKAVTKELGKFNIRINTISLGTVPHEEDIIDDNEYFEFHKSNLAIKEFVTPKDVADTIYSLVYFLKSITGQNIILDMGQSV